MKFWIWKHKGAFNFYNFYPLSKVEKLEPNGIRPIAVHAFFRKKDAIAYMHSLSWGECTEYYELIGIKP